MGLFDSTFFKKKNIINFSNQYNVSLESTGSLVGGISTNTEFKTLVVEVSDLSGTAEIRVIGKLAMGAGTNLPCFDIMGNIYNNITRNGTYFIDVSCIRYINLYNAVSNASSIILSLNYVNDSIDFLTHLKPIQRLAYKEVSITSNQNVTVFGGSDPIDLSYFKYFFIACNIKDSDNSAIIRHIVLYKNMRAFFDTANTKGTNSVLIYENDGYGCTTEWQEVNGVSLDVTIKLTDYVSGDKALVSLYGVR